MSRQNAERRGRRAEGWAALWLQLKGWRILARRVRTPVGEVDLVARRGGTLAFVEVKTRGRAGDLAMLLSERQLRRVAAAAQYLAGRYGRGVTVTRIDVVLVAPGRLPVHVPNVWHG